MFYWGLVIYTIILEKTKDEAMTNFVRVEVYTFDETEDAADKSMKALDNNSHCSPCSRDVDH